MFSTFPLFLNLIISVGLATFVWQAGTRLSYFIDAIAEQTKIARAFLGLVLLATATELPEMVTTLTAAVQGTPELALNNMFGGMLIQIAVLAIADIFVVHGTLTSYPRKPTPVIAGLFLMLSLSILLVLQQTGDITLAFHVGLGSIAIAVLYGIAMFILQRFQHHTIWSAVDIPDHEETNKRYNRYDDYTLRHLILDTVIAAAVILIAGILLVRMADTLAVQTGLGTSFVGVSLLALTTSLPELSTCIAAIRVKAYSMAISNIFGSNLIMTFLIFPVDLFYTKGAVINEINDSATFAVILGIVLTAIYCLALLIRSPRKIFGMGADSALILIVYIAGLYGLYQLR